MVSTLRCEVVEADELSVIELERVKDDRLTEDRNAFVKASIQSKGLRSDAPSRADAFFLGVYPGREDRFLPSLARHCLPSWFAIVLLTLSILSDSGPDIIQLGC